MRRICTFKVSDVVFGIDVLRVLGVFQKMDIVRVPHANKAIRGIVHYKGQILTVIDLGKKFDIHNRSNDEIGLHTIIKTKNGLVSFLVDEVGEIKDIQQNTRMDINRQQAGIDSMFISHSYRIDGNILSIIDTEKIMDMKLELTV
jgi:purine-binding chemotaxis protein CheW